MKVLKIGIGVVLLAVLFASCVDVNPGEVAVRAWKRGDQAGQTEILTVGRHSLSIRATDFMYPTKKVNYVWTKDPAEGSPNDESITFTIEGLQVGVDIGIEYRVIPDKVDIIFSEYRATLDQLTDGPMRNFVRDAILDAAARHTSMEKFITANGIAEMVNEVEKGTISYFTPKGIEVSRVYLVNAPRYPDTVVASIESKIKATQDALRMQNEVATKRAEAEKRQIDADTRAYETTTQAKAVADSTVLQATAEAKAADMKRQSYTDALLRALWIEKWDGHLPSVSSDPDLIYNPGM